MYTQPEMSVLPGVLYMCYRRDVKLRRRGCNWADYAAEITTHSTQRLYHLRDMRDKLNMKQTQMSWPESP